jgi:hypothetical protein
MASLRRQRDAVGFERAAQSQWRQQHDALQLATERQQSRLRLVFPEHRDGDARPAAAPMHSSQQQSGGRTADVDHSHHGWVASSAPGAASWQFLIAKYGAQTDRDWQWMPMRQRHFVEYWEAITGNDPNDANRASNSTSSSSGQHLVSLWGAQAGLAITS